MTVPRTSRHGQRGQALTEFIVLAAALIPLFLLMPMIAKYQDMAHATQMASRYAAFDAAVRNEGMSSWKSQSELNDEIRRRFFGNNDALIRSSEPVSDDDANHNAFWRNIDGKPLLASFADVRVSYGQAQSNDPAQGYSKAQDGVPFPMAGEFGLVARGLHTANVSVAIANLPAGIRSIEPFDKIDLTMARSTSLLIDPWTAAGPGSGTKEVEGRVGRSAAVFPAGKLQAPSAIVDASVIAVESPGQIQGPKLGQLSFWRDIVPDDRLKP